VYRARNKLDGVDYAVKKIRLKSLEMSEKVLTNHFRERERERERENRIPD
jgi:hypothetical protein